MKGLTRQYVPNLHVLQHQQDLAVFHTGAVELHHVGVIAQALKHVRLLLYHLLRVCQGMLQDP